MLWFVFFVSASSLSFSFLFFSSFRSLLSSFSFSFFTSQFSFLFSLASFALQGIDSFSCRSVFTFYALLNIKLIRFSSVFFCFLLFLSYFSFYFSFFFVFVLQCYKMK